MTIDNMQKVLSVFLTNGRYTNISLFDASMVKSLMQLQLPDYSYNLAGFFRPFAQSQPNPNGIIGYIGRDVGVTTFMGYDPVQRNAIILFTNSDSPTFDLKTFVETIWTKVIGPLPSAVYSPSATPSISKTPKAPRRS